MKTGLRVVAFFCFSFLLIVSASAVVQSIWVKLTTDSRTVVKEIVTAEVNKQDSYSSPEQAAGNFRTVQKEKDDEDASYKADLRSVTGEFNRTKQKRDDLTTRFQSKSQELEEIQKSIQNLKKGIENYNSSIARFEEDIKSQQLSLEKWLKTEKQGEAAVAVIYTRGFKDVAHDLEKLADQASAPLLAESMGVKIRSYSQVINNVLAKDIVQATVEGTSKPMNEEPFKLELDKTPAGTVYLRLKRYELFPFQYPAEGRVKPAKDAGRFKARIVTSGADLEAFLKASGYSPSKGDLVRLQQVIEDAKENNRTAESSLGSQIETYQSRIKQLKEKIEDQRAEKSKDEKKLTRDQETYQKLKGETTAAETAKGNAEREFQQSQLHLQEKKRVRETIIVKDARAVPKGSEAPADAVAAVIIDKLEEVRNDARTQHSTATTTVVNFQITSEQAAQAVTDARILAVRLISFVNEGESGVRVQIAFRVRTVLSADAEGQRQAASVPPAVSKPSSPQPEAKQDAPRKDEVQSNKDAIKAEDYNDRGLAYDAQGQYQQAIKEYDEAIRLKKDYEKAYSNRGAAYFALGQNQQAIKDYGEAIRLNKDFDVAYSNRGAAYSALGQNQQAIKDYDEAIRLNKDFADAYLGRGNAYQILVQDQQAIKDYDEAIRLKPDNEVSYHGRGTAYYNLGQYQRAVKDYDEAIRLNKDFAEAYRDRGNAYQILVQNQQAIKDYNESIRLKKDDADVFHRRGMSYFYLGQYQLAIKDYEDAIELKNDDARTYNSRATAYALLGQHDVATKDYDKAIRLTKDDANYYYNRGSSYFHLGQYQRAIKDFDDAIRLKKDYADAYHGRGVSYYQSGQQQRAIKDYDDAIRLKKDAGFYISRGTAYLDLGQNQRAIKDYDEAIRLKPNDALAYDSRGKAYVYSNNNREGCSSLIKACKMGVCEGYDWSKQKGFCK